MLNESQRAALEAFCDTVVPSIERDDDPHGHWARKASDLMIAAAVEDLIGQIPDEVTRGGMLQLLDVLDAQGLARRPRRPRASRSCATSPSPRPTAPPASTRWW